MPFSRLILCHPLLLLPPIPSSIRVFSNESTLRMRWPKYWSFSFNIIPSKEHLGLISFTMDWLDLLAVQGTLKSLLQHHSSKASILQRLAFFTVQLSHPYMTTRKTIALTKWTFVGKVMSTSTWIWHGCTRVPHPEPPSHLPPCTIPQGHPSAPAPSILYPASNLDWRFISYIILYMFQCHSHKSVWVQNSGVHHSVELKNTGFKITVSVQSVFSCVISYLICFSISLLCGFFGRLNVIINFKN